MDQGAGDGDRAFQRVDRWFGTELIGCRGHQSAARFDELLPRVEQHEAPRTIGVLGFTHTRACLPHQSRLLITQRATNRYLASKGSINARHTPVVGIPGWHDAWQHGGGDIEHRQHVLVPTTRRDIHEQCATGVGHIGDERAAVRSTRQPPDQPGIDRTEERFTGVCFGT